MPRLQWEPVNFSPASMGTGRSFAWGGRGLVAYGVNPHGGVFASLKS